MINRDEQVPRRGRPRNFDRDAVLDRAMQTFWKLGYEGASIADLTAAMGITAQSLYAAFGSKSALYREALGRYRDTAGAFPARALTEETSAVAGFERLLNEAATEYSRPRRPRGCMISTGVLVCAAENRDEAKHVAQLRRDTIGLFRQRLDAAIDAGELAPDADSAGLARYLGAIVQGMAVQAQDGASRDELLAIAQVAVLALKQHRRVKARRA
ncbi:TetR/AcrR family transcriptional regulator [Paraburkholderia caballeronis]|uniref:TetR/AcrR family transcriptional regulator n=1 Tax=Paraburkholderia caballeronis TaxID=416943 RepID=UPI001AB05AC1|nr:TetR/AcrR family transcriptional regulator [Paraburkholderia caballeronis]